MTGLSDRAGSSPRRALRSAGKSGHIPDGNGALARGPSGRRRQSDVGRISRLIVQAKKLSRFLLPDRRQRAYMRKVRASGLFDAAFYTTHHPACAGSSAACPSATT